MRLALLLVLAVLGPSGFEVPALSGRVLDRANVLSPHVEAALIDRLAAHEAATSNQVVVLTVSSLKGDVLEEVATRVFRTWGLGQAERDNGVLLLIAVEDREVRIEVGYGLEGDLTDATAGSIIRSEIVPRFRAGNYDEGVLGAVEAILGSIAGTYTPPRRSGISINGEPAEFVPLWERLLFALFFGGFAVALTLPFLVRFDAGGAADLGTVGLGLFSGAFVGGAATIVLLSNWGFVVGLVGVPIAYVVATRYFEASPYWSEKRKHWREKRAAFRRARARGDRTVVVGGRTYRVPTSSGGSGSSSGGFSGGGGSSGGGGASGSW